MRWIGQTGGWRGVSAALMAAVLFGMSTPVAKAILPRVDPVLLAGLLYLGSGLGLRLCLAARQAQRPCAKRGDYDTRPALG
jgi:drug/metabolite transporter (DMT)-like permease